MADVGKRNTKKKRSQKRANEEVSPKVAKKSKTRNEPTSDDDEEHDVVSNKDAIAGWSQEELNMLIDNVTATLPSKDIVKYSTTLGKLDFEVVKFGRFDADQCSAAWKHILTKVRRYRTMTEIAADAKDWAKRPWSSFTKQKQKHPDLPKKPLTPFFRFFLEQRPKIPQSMSTTDTAKYVSKKFAELPDKKKKKYKDGYDAEMVVYRQRLEAFIAQHPEEVLSMPKSKVEGPDKPHSPFDLYKASKIKDKLAAGVTKKDALEQIRKSWANLNDAKRLKWIRKALSDEVRYHAELQEYLKTHPSFEPPTMKPLLTKAEKELKDKSDGKPERPPPSGYNLYSRKTLKTIREGSAKEKMAKISQMWKELSEGERAKFNFEAKKASTKYIEEFENYLNSLPEERRAQALLESKFSKSKSSTSRKMKTDASGQVVGKKSSPKAAMEVAAPPVAEEDDEEEDEDDESGEEDDDDDDES